jgi:hypothetical protein
MDEHSWEAWTTPRPSLPPGLELGYPEGRRLPSGPTPGWIGELRAGTRATDDTIKFAERHWTRVDPDDFEREGRRRFIERSSGIAYDLCRGNVLLSDDPELADCFFCEDGQILFLRRVDRSQVRSKFMGTMGAMPS